MNKPVILLGAGGHASVLYDLLQRLGIEVIAIVAPKNKNESTIFSGVTRLEQDEQVYDYNPDSILLVNGIGSLPGNHLRKNLYGAFTLRNYKFMTVISPTADVSPYAKLSDGIQVMSGAVVQAGAEISENVIINTRASVDHDCLIRAHCHIAPGVTLSGHVVLEQCVHVGTGASVTEGLTVGENAVIGAGACVTKNIKIGSVVYPAKIFIREKK